MTSAYSLCVFATLFYLAIFQCHGLPHAKPLQRSRRDIFDFFGEVAEAVGDAVSGVVESDVEATTVVANATESVAVVNPSSEASSVVSSASEDSKEESDSAATNPSSSVPSSTSSSAITEPSETTVDSSNVDFIGDVLAGVGDALDSIADDGEVSTSVTQLSEATSTSSGVADPTTSVSPTVTVTELSETTSASSDFDFFGNLLGGIGDAINGVAANLEDTVNAVASNVGDAVNAVGDTISSVVTTVVDNGATNGVNVWEAIQTAIGIAALVPAVIFAVLNAVNLVNVLIYWGQIAFYIVSGFVSLSSGNIIEAATNLVNVATSLFSYPF